MLITNFAAGELSENLFGRTDLPQYFSGVSRLENFDVIPTGGIKRRAGTERLAALPEEGRLIPFAVDRQNHFLLYLMPGKIAVIKNGSVRNVIESPEGLALYASLPEIREAQYAQNFDTLILVHENYPPLMAKYDKAGDAVTISAFFISYAVETVVTPGLSPAAYAEDDRLYSQKQFLKSAGNYPRAATFFNGRLVFAGTANDPQRVFASRAGDIHSFAAYKKFMTEQREYVVVNGSVDPERTNEITLDEYNGGGLQFAAALSEYVAASTFYPDNTRIKTLKGNLLELTKGASVSIGVPPNVKAALETFANDYTTWNGQTVETEIITYWFSFGTIIDGIVSVKLYYGVSTARVKATCIAWWNDSNIINDEALELSPDTPSHPDFIDLSLARDAARSVENDGNFLLNIITRLTDGDAQSELAVRTLAAVPPVLVGAPYTIDHYETHTGRITFAAGAWKARVLAWMRYTYDSKKFYGYGDQIQTDILARYDNYNNIYIPFYTSKVLEDRYPAPDDGFTFEIASDMADAIRWVAVNKGVIIGTETAEWIIPPGVTAVNVYAALNSRYGSDTVQGAVIGDAACFFQAGKKALAEYYIPQQDNNFRANNMAMLSPAMLAESPALEFDFARSPYSKLFITREDGTAVTLLYERGTGTFAWGRITTAGEIKSAAVLPGADGNDDVYLAVVRDKDYFLERLREAAAAYLDSFERWTGANGHYSDDALVLDGASGESWPKALAPAPEEGAVMWIGCPYASRARSMPVLANDRMKPNNIKTLLVRFLRSSMPQIKSLPNGVTDTVPREEPFSGITRIPFPGVWDTDVMFEFIHDKPAGCVILAINAEVN